MRTTGVQPCILFDWGDTLMRDFKEFDAPMKDWPYVEAIPGAAEVLRLLEPNFRLCVASNADVSDARAIRAALQRVNLDACMDKIFSSMEIGFRKPAPEFFAHILTILSLPPEGVIMVGDSYEGDILGATRCGLRAVWFNQHDQSERQEKNIRTIHALAELPDVLEQWDIR